MDKYVKAALTVIAAALVAIALQNVITPAQAVGNGCGFNMYNPCYVKIAP
ncbi:hypothetical protein [Rhizobium leucaenae]|uniref:Uncharacterized protein n=1 Tax=Rhizobium leucaenae TaxID=29450 RepID=A0A7W7EJ75_9HYPH|nr:hypothetical protein [Rhizobium leucaenae]MBB4567062.1 hypothetical protein [Rhizobium leucaenae]MBB6300872.1 hypothetical protein [Rhizobium leucaenae]